MKVVETRYQWLSKDGIVWTKWFNDYTPYKTEEECLEVIKKYKEISSKQKLKHEYRVADYAEPEKVKHCDPLGLYIGGLKKIERMKKAKEKK